MKRMNVKRLAALGAGIALLGTALAPVVSAISLTRSDVINANGSPVYDIVVGPKASSDALWAGNIAAKLAQLAYTDSAVTCTIDRSSIGGGEEVRPSATVSGLSVELVVGGETTYGEDGVNYKYELEVDSSTKETLNPAELGNSRLSSLLDTTWKYTKDGRQYDMDIKEKLQIRPDLLFEESKEVKDLVLYLDSEKDFVYSVTLNPGIPFDFNKDSRNTIYVPLLGGGSPEGKYTVQKVNSNGTEITLISEEAKKTLTAGSADDKITGLEGKGRYAGKALTLKFVSLTKHAYLGTSTVTYKGTFHLLDPENNLIAEATDVEAGEFLDQRIYVSGENPLATSVYVDSLFEQVVDGSNKATITVGPGTVKLVHGEKYPYDETVTSSSQKYWKAEFVYGDSDGDGANDTITGYSIYNAAVEGYSKWNWKMPVYAKKNSLTGNGAKSEAVFLNGEPNAPGYGRFKVVFDGFVTKPSSELTIKDHKIYYTDDDDTRHEIPLYIGGLSSTTEQTFTFDRRGTQKYYFRMRYTDQQNHEGCFEIVGAPLSGTLDCDSATATFDATGGTYYDELPFDLEGDNGKYKYYWYYSTVDRSVWLLLKKQVFKGKGGYELEFKGTDTTEDLDDGLEYLFYMPNRREFGGGKSGEFYTAVFELTEPDNDGKGTIYIDTRDGSLAPFGNSNYSVTGSEFKYTRSTQKFDLTQDDPSYNLQKAYSDYGSEFDISNDYFWARIPEDRLKARVYVVGPQGETTIVVGGETILLNEGEERITSAGTRITAKKINYNVSVTPTVCPAGGVVVENIKATPSISTAKRIVPVGQLVFTHDAALSGKPKIIVGGWKVNRYAQDITLSDGKKLTERLTARGDYVVDKLSDGSIIVAGYTAADTEAAARELIRELDRLLG
ncbi:MAG: hypothetical protein QW400_01275 [Candidatus Diapherotrites archaeon]